MSVFSRDDQNSPPTLQNSTAVETLEDYIFYPETVLKFLKNIKPSHSCGPDMIPNIVLKKCAEELCGPLSTLFNFSFQEQKLPNSWLNAKIFPIFKNKGDPSLCKNYRPISLTSCLCKIMERILKSKIVKFCEKK